MYYHLDALSSQGFDNHGRANRFSAGNAQPAILRAAPAVDFPRADKGQGKPLVGRGVEARTSNHLHHVQTCRSTHHKHIPRKGWSHLAHHMYWLLQLLLWGDQDTTLSASTYCWLLHVSALTSKSTDDFGR